MMFCLMITAAWGTEPVKSAATVELVAPDRLATRLLGPSDKPVRVYNLWATWCGPCKAEMPLIKAWAEAHPAVEVTFVSLDHPKMSASAVVPYVEATGLTAFQHVQIDDPDPGGIVPKVFPEWSGVVPVTFVVGPDGTVKTSFDGALSDEKLATIAP